MNGGKSEARDRARRERAESDAAPTRISSWPPNVGAYLAAGALVRVPTATAMPLVRLIRRDHLVERFVDVHGHGERGREGARVCAAIRPQTELFHLTRQRGVYLSCPGGDHRRRTKTLAIDARQWPPRRASFLRARAGRMSPSTPAPVAPKVLTLLMIVRDGRVLLGLKKRGFGEGFLNGFGGKVEPGETVDEAALRELREEAGISALDATRRGVLTFVYDDQPRPMRVHVYHASAFEGTPTETDEMRPEWHAIDAVPFAKMWPDDEHWYPAFLAGNKFVGTFWFTNTTTIVAHDIEEVEDDAALERAATAPAPPAR